MNAWVWLFGALAALAGTGCSTPKSICADPKLISGEKGIHQVAVLPPNLRVQISTVKGPEESFDMAKDFARVFQETFEELLPGYGFRIVPSGLQEGAAPADSEVKFALAGLQDQFVRVRLRVDLNGEVDDSRLAKGQLALGQNLTMLADDCGADALLFSAGGAQIHSRGQKALGVAAAAVTGEVETLSDILYYRVGLVDGKNGKILMVFVGELPLSGFGSQESQPGGKKYPARLDQFRQEVRRVFSRHLTNSLERQPGKTNPAPAPASPGP